MADATALPAMLYDIPGRSGVPIRSETLVRLARHERIVAVKDAKADLFEGSQIIASTGLAYYSGDDTLNLPWLSVGAVGCVSVIGHVVGAEIATMIEAHRSGNVEGALAIHRRLLPVVSAIMMQAGGAIMAKAALSLVGKPAGPMRPPLVEATREQLARLREDLIAGGVKLSDEVVT